MGVVAFGMRSMGSAGNVQGILDHVQKMYRHGAYIPRLVHWLGTDGTEQGAVTFIDYSQRLCTAN